MTDDTVPDPATAKKEQVVLVIGLVITYGATLFWSFVVSMLAVGGGGEATGIYLIGGALLVATVGCFFVSMRLAAARKHVRAILLGLVPIPLVVALVYGGVALVR